MKEHARAPAIATLLLSALAAGSQGASFQATSAAPPQQADATTLGQINLNEASLNAAETASTGALGFTRRSSLRAVDIAQNPFDFASLSTGLALDFAQFWADLAFQMARGQGDQAQLDQAQEEYRAGLDLARRKYLAALNAAERQTRGARAQNAAAFDQARVYINRLFDQAGVQLNAVFQSARTRLSQPRANP